MNYLIRLGDALSQFLNVLLFGGDPNYSISGDAYRLKRVKLMFVIDLIFSPFEEHHCEKAYINDVLKAKKLLEESEAC